jgi:hypothetical protein
MNTRDKTKASLLTAIQAINVKRHFELLKPDFSNVDEVYTNYFNLWLWNMSDNKQGHATITNEWIEDVSKLEFCKTKDGFKLTESDFIKVELNRLEILEPDKLSLIQSKQFEMYVSFLKSKFVNSELPDNTNTDGYKKDLHNHIFKGNSFDVWQSMFSEFGINESSRTDVKFMFEEMKKDSLIHNTVNQITFLDWIRETYNGLIIQKTSNHSRTKTRIQAYQRAKEFYKN